MEAETERKREKERDREGERERERTNGLTSPLFMNSANDLELLFEKSVKISPARRQRCNAIGCPVLRRDS